MASIKKINKIVYPSSVIIALIYFILGNICVNFRNKELTLLILEIYILLMSFIYIIKINESIKKYISYILVTPMVEYIMFLQNGDLANTYIFFIILSSTLIYTDLKLLLYVTIYIAVTNVIFLVIFTKQLVLLDFTINVMPNVFNSFIVSILFTGFFIAIGIRQLISKSTEVIYSKKLANIDALTGITNRRYFFELAQNEWEKVIRFKKNISVLMIDVDFFKKFNDNYGHNTGDEILRIVSYTIQDSLRSLDIVGRYGGEEFIVLLFEAEKNNAMITAERIRISVEDIKLQTVEYGELSCTISIGVSSYTGTEKTFEDLVNIADKHLYKAKKAGRNNVVG